MILVVGLGNPGKEYAQTKHNVGFLVVDEIGKRAGIKLNKKKFQGTFGEGFLRRNKLLLLNPETYMNRSGEAVRSAVEFYKLQTENIMVLQDEMDLPAGRIRIKKGGGSAGHNGIKSIISHLKDKEFIRIRIGIGKPLSKSKAVKHVLSGFNENESEVIKSSILIAADAIEDIIQNGLDHAMNKYNTKPANTEATN